MACRRVQTIAALWIAGCSVRVRDDRGAALSGVRVDWAGTVGDGSVAPVADATDAGGVAYAVWTLGATPGRNALGATASTVEQATFETPGRVFQADAVGETLKMGCGLVAGDAWCWGAESWTTSAPTSIRPGAPMGWTGSAAPGRVPGAAGLQALATSANRTLCALDLAGATWCASGNSPTLTRRLDVPPLRRIAGTSWGWDRFCGLASQDSTAWCWSWDAAVQVPGSQAFTQLDIDGGDGHPYLFFRACGLGTDSTAACWGSGLVGDGSTTPSATPVVVSGGRRFARLAVGEGFACGLEADGEAWCWGPNNVGQMGSAGPDALVPVLAGSNLQDITASEAIVAGVRNGQVVHWGNTGWITPRLERQGRTAGRARAFGCGQRASLGRGGCVGIAGA
jgi:hypothetical protein